MDNEDSLSKLKIGSDKRMREIFESALVKSNLARNLAWAVGLLAIGVMYVTGWVIKNDNAIEKLKEGHKADFDKLVEGQKENRGYIRDIWKKTFDQPLPPPVTDLESRIFEQLKIQTDLWKSQHPPIITNQSRQP
jgi:hypothetical protein